MIEQLGARIDNEHRARWGAGGKQTMILDYELEFTATAGEQFVAAAAAYGSKSVNQKAATDAAVGEPLYFYFMCTVAYTDLAGTVAIELVGDTDGAGAGEVVLLTRAYAQAALTVAKGVRCVGAVPPGTALQYFRAKVTPADVCTTGSLKMWIGKGTDIHPENAGVTIQHL